MSNNYQSRAVPEPKTVDLAFKVGDTNYLLKGVDKELTNKVTSVETKSTQNAAKIVEVEGKVTQNTQKITQIETTANQNTSKIAAVESKANQNTSSIEAINKKIEDLEAFAGDGAVKFAYKDYTQEDAQAEMVVGIRYLVAFNKANQYLQLDKKTGQVASNQAEGVVDKNIDYWKLVLKDSDGIVHTLNQKIDFTGVAYVDQPNTFTESQTFNKPAFANGNQGFNEANNNQLLTKQNVIEKLAEYAPLNGANTFEQPVKSSANQVYESADDNELIKKSTFAGEISKIKSEINAKTSIEVVDSIDKVSSEGKLYFIDPSLKK